MRRELIIVACCVAVAVAVAVTLRSSIGERPPGAPAPAPEASSLLGHSLPSAARPLASVSSAAIALQRAVQARSLRLPLRRGHEPRLAFGKEMVGRLGDSGASVYSSKDGSLLFDLTLEAPRAILSLSDGALLVVGARAMQRIEPGGRPTSLPKPTFLPGAEIFADAMLPDRIWIFDGQLTVPTLSSYRLAAAEGFVLLPEQVVKLEAPPGGLLGATREGVWLYFAAGRAERFAPGGARLGSFVLPELPPSFVVLPSRRLDQAYLLAEDGRLTLALVTPLFKKLSETQLQQTPFAAQVGDEGRLLAILSIVGEGPRFELHLYDERAQTPSAVVPLMSDEPTGRDDWVRAVTRNQQLAVAPRQALVAVGGPDRLLIVDGRGKQVLSIPSR